MQFFQSFLANLDWFMILVFVGILAGLVFGVAFFVLGLTLLVSLQAAGVAGVVAGLVLVVLLGFGGFGEGGGRGDGTGQGKTESVVTARPDSPVKSAALPRPKPVAEPEKENRYRGEVIKVNLKKFVLQGRELTFREFVSQLQKLQPRPRVVTLDYQGRYKAIHIKWYGKLSEKFPEIYFCEVNKEHPRN
jgi:hypothetical protein